MALKNEDTLMKRKRELEEAMRNLGLSIEEEHQEEEDALADQFQMDEDFMKELIDKDKDK